jgi:FKBP-type peptidyl-prolyl cis-trans isomerase SlpA
MEVGGFIRGKTQSGHDLIAKVLEIKENSYILDLNHPLAGKDLKFDIEILEVN